MLKKLFFTIILSCALTASTGISSAAENVIDDAQNPGNNAEKDYSTCQCKNGYCGFNAQFDYVCKCPEEYGLLSSTECKRCDCGKGANCTFKQDWNRDTKTCLCKKGYITVGGLCLGPCDPNPCFNGGSCVDEGGKATCHCKSGYSGDVCLIKDPCELNPCQNGGTCRNSVIEWDYHCFCTAGYSGTRCQVYIDDSPDYTIIKIFGGVGFFLLLVSCFICYRYRRNRGMNNTTVTTLHRPTVVAPPPPVHQNQYVPQYQPVQQFPPPPPTYFEQYPGTVSNMTNAPIAPTVYQRY